MSIVMLKSKNSGFGASVFFDLTFTNKKNIQP